MQLVTLRIQASAFVVGLVMLAIMLVLLATGFALLIKKDYLGATILMGVGGFFTWNLVTTPLELVVEDGDIQLRGLRPRHEAIANISRVDRVRSAWMRGGWAASFIRNDGSSAFELTEYVFNSRSLRELMASLEIPIPMYDPPHQTPSPRTAWTGANPKERLAWVLFAIDLAIGLALMLSKNILGVAVLALSIPLALLAIRAGRRQSPF
jgi:hypothetical protein